MRLGSCRTAAQVPADIYGNRPLSYSCVALVRPSVVPAALRIQSPGQAPRRLWEPRHAGWTGRRPILTIPADRHQPEWEKRQSIPATDCIPGEDLSPLGLAWDGGQLPHPKLICPSCFQHALPPIERRLLPLKVLRRVSGHPRCRFIRRAEKPFLFAKENWNAADDRWTSPGKVVASRGSSNNLRTAGSATLPRTGWTPGNARYSIR